MSSRRITAFFLSILGAGIVSFSRNKADLADYVNPMIGASTSTGAAGVYHGLGKTFPGAVVPYGMVQVSPNTITGGDNGSGYSDEHKTIEGFAFTQMSGVGWFGDLGNFLVMPTTGELKTIAGQEGNGRFDGWRSAYCKDTETAGAGYYSVMLTDYGIRAEATAALHGGVLRFTFPEHGKSRIQIDLARRVGGTSTEQYVKVLDDSTICGWMRCTPDGGGWGNGDGNADYTVNFHAVFSRPFTDYGFWSADIPDSWSRKRDDVVSDRYIAAVEKARIIKGQKEIKGKHIGFFTEFPTEDGEQVEVKVSISFVDMEGARKNYVAELACTDFDRIREDAEAAWNEALSRIKVDGGSNEEKKIFYTALYHTMIDPRIFTDVDGRYIGGDLKVHAGNGRFTKRTIFSGWDVFRSQFPLQTIINPRLVSDEINSLISMAEQSGRGYFERWEFLNSYSGCMIGNPALSVIADAYMKGIRTFDAEKALEYAVNTSRLFGNDRLGYTPGGLCISNTLEYAYADWCVSQLASAMGKEDIAEAFYTKGQAYRNIFDKEKGWFRPRTETGEWYDWPENAMTKEWYGCIESNPFQQGWFVPHDIDGMTDLMGGEEKVTDTLLSFFWNAPESLLWNSYYNHANEPVHFVPFLFNRLNVPHYTQEWTRYICDKAYSDSVDGIVGNEDVGQMSAWYILAASGLHPVCPGETTFEITSPVFDRIEFSLDNEYYEGKKFTVVAHDNSPDNIYIQKAWLNGKEYDSCRIDFSEIAAGGTLELQMGDRPSEWGTLKAEPEEFSLESSNPDVRWHLAPQADQNNASGEEISMPGYSMENEISAVVPGAVFTSYVEAGLEPEPEYGDNIWKADETFYNRPFWYRAEFELPSSYRPGQRVWLQFDNTNRYASFWFNGKQISGNTLRDVSGHMLRSAFDVTELVKRDGKNAIAVLITDPDQKKTRTAKDHYGVVCSPSYLAGAGWDWMPYVPGRLAGITGHCRLAFKGDISMQDPWVRSELPTLDEAHVSVTSDIRNSSGKARKVTVSGTITPGNISFSKDIEVPAGSTAKISFSKDEFSQLVISAPKLWWPNGYGEPDLYECHLECHTDGVLSDRKDITFGIRKYEYRETTNSAGMPVWNFYINGQKIFLKGGNWGMSEYLLRCSGEQYETNIRLHKEMNYNMIRLWTGCVTDDEFYDYCDKYGIMVWNDFWLYVAYNEVAEPEAFKKNARDKVRRLRNHPCIAIWCGANETRPAKELDDYLRTMVAEEDGGDRMYKSCSNQDGLSGSGWWGNYPPKHHFDTPGSNLAFNDPPYPYGPDYGYGMRTEIGTATFPSYESVIRFMPEDSRWPLPSDEQLKNGSDDIYNKHYFGKEASNASPVNYKTAVNTQFGESSSLEEFCEKAQLLNIEVMKGMYEAWNDKMWNDAAGLLIWMSHPAYPCFVWQTYDYYYDPTGAYWGAKKACEHLHVQWNASTNSIKAINTTSRDCKKAKVKATLFDINGNEIKGYGRKAVVDIPASDKAEAFTLDFPDAGTSPLYFIRLEMTDRKGNLLSENFYWKNIETDLDYTALSDIPEAETTVECIASDKEKGKYTLRLTNRSSSVSFANRLRLVNSRTGERVLPVIMSDNYITLMPGESRTVEVEAALELMEGGADVLIKQYGYEEKEALSLDRNLLVKDMVHHNPGEALTDSDFLSPSYLKSLGYGSKVFFLFESAQFGIDWKKFDSSLFPDNSEAGIWVEEKRKEITAAYDSAKAEGLQRSAPDCATLYRDTADFCGHDVGIGKTIDRYRITK